MNEKILLQNRKKDKVYKPEESNNISMLPGNPKGLPDESFFLNLESCSFDKSKGRKEENEK